MRSPASERADPDDRTRRRRPRPPRSPSAAFMPASPHDASCSPVSTFGGVYSAPCLIRMRSESNGASARSDRPVPFDDDRRVRSEQLRRVPGVVDARPSFLPSVTSKRTPRRRLLDRSAEPPRPRAGSAIVPRSARSCDRFGHGAEVHDVLGRARPRARRSRRSRPRTRRPRRRSDHAGFGRGAGAGASGGDATVVTRPRPRSTRATMPRRASCAARSRASSRRR